MLFMSSRQAAAMTDGGESGPLRSVGEQAAQLTAPRPRTSPQTHTRVTNLHKYGAPIRHYAIVAPLASM